MTKNSKARSLILLVALAAVVILAAGWFLLILPVLTGASDANAQAQAQEDANAQTQIEVNKLRQQYADLPAYEASLASLQLQIPTTPQYAELQKMFASVAREHDVVISSLEFGSAAALVPAKPDSAPASGDSASSATPAPSASPGPDSTDGTGGPKTVANLYGIPVTLTVAGTYDSVMEMLRALQTTVEGRIVLVTTVDLTHNDDGSTNAIQGAKGDTTGVFGGLVFVLEDPNADKVADGSDASPSPSPEPTN